MRKKIYEIIQPGKEGSRISSIYDVFMMIIILVSLIPLAFKNNTGVLFSVTDNVVVVVFILDYLARLCTADFQLNRGALSFFLYPLTPMAILDLLCILPSLNILGAGFRILKIFRLVRTFRVFRAFKIIRYSKSFTIILNVIRDQRTSLLAVCTLAIGYILIAALVVFNVEPETFETFFDAIYWATVSLTTVGYGDIYPVTRAGRIVTMLSSFIGIAIIALPSGIITAGYMAELNRPDNEEEDS